MQYTKILRLFWFTIDSSNFSPIHILISWNQFHPIYLQSNLPRWDIHFLLKKRTVYNNNRCVVYLGAYKALSGSRWKEEHIQALRVVYLDNLAINRFFDRDYIPTNNDNGRWALDIMEFAANCMYVAFFQISRDISVATEDNLREFTSEFADETQNNPFFVLFISGDH